MKEHQMYPYNPGSAESVLNEKMKKISHAWLDGQRAIVIEAMEEYAKAAVNAKIDEVLLSAMSFTRYSKMDPITTDELNEILESLKLK